MRDMTPDEAYGRVRQMVGLDGPAVSVAVSRIELAQLHELHGLTPAHFAYRRRLAEILREMDIRYGAAASMRPEACASTVTAPISLDEIRIVRDCWTAVLEYEVRINLRLFDLMRNLDRRIGAAQAALATLEAASALDAWRPDPDLPVIPFRLDEEPGGLLPRPPEWRRRRPWDDRTAFLWFWSRRRRQSRPS